jgi:septum formation inhibitor-activating ATPase MinD
MGRKSLKDESYKESIVKLAWKHIKSRLLDKNCPVGIKDEIAKAISVKTAPQEVKGGAKSDRLIIIGNPKVSQVKDNTKVIEISSS